LHGKHLSTGELVPAADEPAFEAQSFVTLGKVSPDRRPLAHATTTALSVLALAISGCSAPNGDGPGPFTPSLQESFRLAELPRPNDSREFESVLRNGPTATTVSFQLIVDRDYLKTLKRDPHIEARFSRVSNPLIGARFFEPFESAELLGSFAESLSETPELTRLITLTAAGRGEINLLVKAIRVRRSQSN
jgi:hypothetical protein